MRLHRSLQAELLWSFKGNDDITSYLLRDGGNVHPEPLRPFLQLINVHLRQQKQHIYLVFSNKMAEMLYF